MIDLSTHATPVNAMARRELTAPKGVLACTRIAPALHGEPVSVVQARHPNLPDLTDVVFGAGARVVGFYQWRGETRESLWVVRCSCGLHETISTKTVTQHQKFKALQGDRYRPWVCTQCYLKKHNAEVSGAGTASAGLPG